MKFGYYLKYNLRGKATLHHVEILGENHVSIESLADEKYLIKLEDGTVTTEKKENIYKIYE